MSDVEAWMRGPIDGVNPLVAPLLFSFQQAREDVAHFTQGLTTEQVWKQYPQVNAVGREIRHIGGSVDRLTTYLKGQRLSEEQLQAINTESEPGASLEELIRGMEAAFNRAESLVRSIDPEALTEAREVGRKRLPTTVIGLIVHIAEHTQRHVGQMIIAAKLARLT